ncbi:MAG: hypothetical protein ACK5MV_08510 [Aminipila sp.]
MKKKILAGIVSAGLIISMSVPVFAEEGYTLSYSQSGLTIEETIDSFDINMNISELNMTFAEAIMKYEELKSKYDKATTENEKKIIKAEMTEIETVLKTTFPDIYITMFDKPEVKEVAEVTNVEQIISYFLDEGMRLTVSERVVNGEIEKLEMSDDMMQPYLEKLNEVRTVISSLTAEKKEDIYSILKSFREVVKLYENSTVLINEIDSILNNNIKTDTNKVVSPAKSYSDVSSSHWAYKNIMTMVN